jgi:hypothetical protein
MEIKFLTRLINLDIFDVNFDLSSKEINQVHKLGSGKFDLLEGIIRFIYFMTKAIVMCQFNLCLHTKSVCFFIGSKNQERAFKPLIARLNNNNNNYYYGSYAKNKFCNSEAISYIISLLFLPLLIYKYFLTKDVFLKKMMRCRLDRYLHSYGLFILYDLAARYSKKKTKIIFFSNDHTVWNRVHLEVAIFHNIPTAYIQHANVSKTFPQLNFNYAFLDGDYAKNTYLNISKSNTKIFCIGCLRMELISSEIVTGLCADKSIICCFNKADSNAKILNILNTLQENNRSSLIAFRMHPADLRLNFQKMLQENHFIDETHTECNIVFHKFEVCVAGNSGVFLDAYSSGAKCASYSQWFGVTDYYKFQKFRLVEVYDSIEEINQLNLQQLNIPNSKNSPYFSVDDKLQEFNTPSERIISILKFAGINLSFIK